MTDVEHSTVLDSGQQLLGVVYAKALLGAAEKAGVTETVLNELESFVDDVLSQVPDLDAMLSSPRITLEAKESILNRAFEQEATPVFLNFLKLTAKRGRFDCMRAMARAARELYNQSHGRVEVLVRSATELDESTREQTATRLQEILGKDVDLHVHIDESVIGGIVVQVGDTVFDGSVANRLQRLKNEMLSRSSEQIRNAPERFAVSEGS